MKSIIKGLFYAFDDNIRDSKDYFNYYREAKGAGCPDMAQWFLNEAKSRIDKNETVKSKIEYLIKNNMPEAEDSVYKMFYDSKLEECMKLKEKYMSATV